MFAVPAAPAVAAESCRNLRRGIEEPLVLEFAIDAPARCAGALSDRFRFDARLQCALMVRLHYAKIKGHAFFSLRNRIEGG
jgi:hypothetical protein